LSPPTRSATDRTTIIATEAASQPRPAWPAATGGLRYGAAEYGRCPREEFVCLAWSLSIIVTFLVALD
jgi:hypothetical protein